MYSTHTTMHEKGNFNRKKKQKQLATQLVRENTLLLRQSFVAACCPWQSMLQKWHKKWLYAFFSFLLCTDFRRWLKDSHAHTCSMYMHTNTPPCIVTSANQGHQEEHKHTNKNSMQKSRDVQNEWIVLRFLSLSSFFLYFTLGHWKRSWEIYVECPNLHLTAEDYVHIMLWLGFVVFNKQAPYRNISCRAVN